MPDRRRHRGSHPEDVGLFSEDHLDALRAAASDLCWLFDRGYASASSLKLVGDRYRLVKRQRIAVARCVCSREAEQNRVGKQVGPEAMRGGEIWIDGYNALTTIEAALSGGVILKCRDGCFRDMASMHGSYRQVAETTKAINLLGGVLADCGVSRCRWLLDRPVSNSGRLKSTLVHAAAISGWRWEVALTNQPDRELSETPHVIVTADSAILDRCQRWFNLARATVEQCVAEAWVVKFV